MNNRYTCNCGKKFDNPLVNNREEYRMHIYPYFEVPDCPLVKPAKIVPFSIQCECGHTLLSKMDYKIHRNPYSAVPDCPKVVKLKTSNISKYAPQPKYLSCDPVQNYKVVVSSNEVNSFKIHQKWLDEKKKVEYVCKF